VYFGGADGSRAGAFASSKRGSPRSGVLSVPRGMGNFKGEVAILLMEVLRCLDLV
jgi:hypothetical protein